MYQLSRLFLRTLRREVMPNTILASATPSRVPLHQSCRTLSVLHSGEPAPSVDDERAHKEESKMSSSSDDSGPEDKVPPAKKPKVSTKAEKSKAKTSSREKEADEEKLEIGRNRFVTVNEFHGKTRIDIREFYVDRETDELKPGKKGISLSVDEWKKLQRFAPKIDEKIGEAED